MLKLGIFLVFVNIYIYLQQISRNVRKEPGFYPTSTLRGCSSLVSWYHNYSCKALLKTDDNDTTHKSNANTLS